MALKCRFDKSRQVVRAWREGFALSCVTFRWRDAARPVLLAELPDIVRHLKIGSLHERADFRRGGELVEIVVMTHAACGTASANAVAKSFSSEVRVTLRHVERNQVAGETD